MGSSKAAELTVRWPSGAVDVVTNLPADQLIAIEEGSAPAATQPAN
jgi:hypothetical protein